MRILLVGKDQFKTICEQADRSSGNTAQGIGLTVPHVFLRPIDTLVIQDLQITVQVLIEDDPDLVLNSYHNLAVMINQKPWYRVAAATELSAEQDLLDA